MELIKIKNACKNWRTIGGIARDTGLNEKEITNIILFFNSLFNFDNAIHGGILVKVK